MKMNEDPICLSSDEESEPSAKKIKSDNEQIPQNKKEKDVVVSKNISNIENIICLDSDEDDDSENTVVVDTELNGSIKILPKNSTDDLNQVEVISCDSPSTLNLSNGSSSTSKDSQELESSTTDTSESEYYAEEELQSSKVQTKISQSEEQSDSSISKSALMADTADLPIEAIKFLSTCRNVLSKESAEPIFRKFPVIIKMFRSLSEEFSKTEYLNKFLRKQTKTAGQSVSCCIISFRDVYQHLKDNLNSKSIELPKEHWKHVRKLEKFMEQVLAKLKELEETEVDFDEDEDRSAYILHAKYAQKLNQAYNKYCGILKKNPYSGRLTYERLDFVSSNYNEINQAISKKYKNNKIFPSYSELATFIESIVADKKLPLNSIETKRESEHCFKELGELLQTRRKKELYEAHEKYLIGNDPAKNDEELEKKLRISSKEGKVRLEQICQEYVTKQELGLIGEEIDLSEAENCDDENQSDEDF
ncbi:uncharacterized protein LOC123677625 [Harmonia axyridis]|uniref:uncharacterized protein LOC123677625 n=1 Tax=Harmonia axyridis TaxID=115357 RepID=UPI001E276577|nr:uncharacterized protein LOC123677625 [Harmonia axyridis]